MLALIWQETSALQHPHTKLQECVQYDNNPSSLCFFKGNNTQILGQALHSTAKYQHAARYTDHYLWTHNVRAARKQQLISVLAAISF